jgi:hypothetical protein
MNFRSPTAGPRRWGIFVLVAGSAALVALVAILASSRRGPDPSATPRKPARPSSLDGSGWELTSEGEFEEHSAELLGSRLRLRAASRHSRDETTKFLGVRHRDEIKLTPGARVRVDLDWNRQSNGSGLTAGIVLAPAFTTGNPLKLPAGLWVEFIGVPPGRNARRVIGMRESSRHRTLDSEGWPDRDRTGRAIGVQRLEILIGEGGSFRVLENGQEVYASPSKALPFDRARVYLQMSTRPNYPPREIFFDNIVIESGN